MIKSSKLSRALETSIPRASPTIEVAVVATKLVGDGTFEKDTAFGKDLCGPLEGKKFKGNLAAKLH